MVELKQVNRLQLRRRTYFLTFVQRLKLSITLPLKRKEQR